MQAKEAAAREEKGTTKVNIAAGPTADEFRTLISDAIEEMEGVGFLQSASDHPMFQQQKERETLHTDLLYLDTASSFNQAFVGKHMDEVKMAVFDLRGKCNSGVSHANEKGWYGDLLNLCLVQNGIANLLYIP